MNFPPHFRKLIHLCIFTASSINLNGSLFGNFKSSRGLSKVALSPCLFNLVMKNFTQLLKSKTQLSPFQFHDKCEPLRISSLAFADDLFILSKVSIQSIRIIKDALEEFQSLSGRKLNFLKSEVFVSGATSRRKKDISRILGMPIGVLPIRYLSVPLVFGKLSYSDCSLLLDQLNHRINSWAIKNISYGRESNLYHC